MATVTTNNQYYTDIANAIRDKNGTQTQYMPSEMAAAITAISGGGSQNNFGLSIPIDIFWKKLFDPSKIIFSMTTFFIFLAPIMLKSDNVQVSLYDFDYLQNWENQNIDTSMLPTYYQAIKSSIESAQVSSPSELSNSTVSEVVELAQGIYSNLGLDVSIVDGACKLKEGDTDIIVVNTNN